MMHTALRHLQALPTGQHIGFVALPTYLRKHPAFTPYFKDSRTVSAKESTFVAYATALPERTCVLAFAANARHVHSSPNAGDHAASFKIRVGGKSMRALLDTGATCSCITKQAVDTMGLTASGSSGQSSEIVTSPVIHGS
jgi:hypothetical protein